MADAGVRTQQLATRAEQRASKVDVGVRTQQLATRAELLAQELKQTLAHLGADSESVRVTKLVQKIVEPVMAHRPPPSMSPRPPPWVPKSPRHRAAPKRKNKQPAQPIVRPPWNPSCGSNVLMHNEWKSKETRLGYAPGPEAAARFMQRYERSDQARRHRAPPARQPLPDQNRPWLPNSKAATWNTVHVPELKEPFTSSTNRYAGRVNWVPRPPPRGSPPPPRRPPPPPPSSSDDSPRILFSAEVQTVHRPAPPPPSDKPTSPRTMPSSPIRGERTTSVADLGQPPPAPVFPQ